MPSQIHAENPGKSPRGLRRAKLSLLAFFILFFCVAKDALGQAPAITSITPSPAVSGQQVTISGSNFGSTSGYVVFGSIAYPWVSSWTDTQIVTAVPNNAQSGLVYILTSSGAQSNSVSLTVAQPSITSISPTTAAPGQQVTIAGTNFGSTSGYVVFGSIAYPWVSSWTNTQIVVTVPSNAQTGLVYVQNPGGGQSNSVSLTVSASPNITSISPMTAVAGQPVTITGTNFGSASAYVVFGSIAYPWVSSWTSNQIVVTVPSNAQTGPVYVQNSFGVQSNSVSLTVAQPSITTISPTTAAPGQPVTITGMNFGSTSGYVVFGSIAYPWVSSWTNTQIVVTVPSNAQTGLVYVQNPGGGQSNSVSLTVSANPNITSISPMTAVAGQPVTITGTNFGSTSAYVVFGSIAYPWVSSWTNTQIVVTVPSNAQTGPVYVQNSYGVQSNSVSLTVANPSITSISPTTAAPGQQVTITGTNFGSTSGYVVFGSIAYPWVTSWTNTQIVVTVPSNAQTGLVYVRNPGGGQSNLVSLTVSASPNITGINPMTAVAGQQVTITGTNFGSTSAYVVFGSITYPWVSSWTSTQIVVTVPSNAQSGPVYVLNSYGVQSNSVSLTVADPSITSISPTAALTGQQVTITGTNFGSTSAYVVFGSIAYPWVSSWTNTQIVVTVPSNARTGLVYVQNLGGAQSNSINLTVTVAAGFVYTGSLNTGRLAHTATLLNNGMVLMAGGQDVNGNSLSSAELYNPATGSFTPTGGLNAGRWGHTATLLNNGMVLLAGGVGSSDFPIASAELYNPATGTFTPTGGLNKARVYHTATLLNNGMVLMAGGIGYGAELASAELFDPTIGTFTSTGSMNTVRFLHTATLLNNGMVLMAGGQSSSDYVLASAELYNLATGIFTYTTGSLNTARYGHTATLLNDGLVVMAGGANASGTPLDNAELYNPAAGSFTPTGNLKAARSAHTATLLNNGTLLIAGGMGLVSTLASAELYDPTAGTFTPTGSLNTARYGHTATLLNNGIVLVAGGLDQSYCLASAELYDPATITPPNLVSIALSPSSPAIPLDTAQRMTATGTFSDSSMQQLASVTWDSSNPAAVSITDDASNLGAAYAALAAGSATVSACAGAVCGSTQVSVAPPALVSIAVTPANSQVEAGLTVQFHATATYTDGSTQDLTSSATWTSSAPGVATINAAGLASGGMVGSTTIRAASSGVQSTTMLTVAGVLVSMAVTPANPSVAAGSTQQFTAKGTYSDGSTQNLTSTAAWSAMPTSVATINATGLASSTTQGSATITAALNAINGTTTLYVTAPVLVSMAVTPANPAITLGNTQQFTATGTYSDGSMQNLTSTATWMSSAPGVATISNTSGSQGLATTTGDGTTTIEAVSGAINGSTTLTVTAGFVYTGSLNTARWQYTATLLNNGMVLMAGGIDANGSNLASAELYNPATGTFTPTGSLNTARNSHTATLLNNGMVLIAGGLSGILASAELYNPATGTFTPTGSLNTGRYLDTATLLNNGMVLFAGGYSLSGRLASAELYDPTTGTFSLTGSLNNARTSFTATLLNNGMVLVAGGIGPGFLASAELYDPGSATFTPTGSMNTARYAHTATLLNNGMVLIAGGGESSGTSGGAELYNPATGSFTLTGNLNTERGAHTATLLNNGMVLMAGGGNGVTVLASAELYDPVAGAFTPTGSLNTARYFDTATRLNNGMVLIAGGQGNSGYLSSAELYQPATLTPPNLVSIAITPAASTLSPGTTQQFIATGTFSDSSTEQLASVTWSSSDPTVAQISNDATNPGTSLAIAPGTVTITGTAGSVSGSATLTVSPTGFVYTGTLNTGR